MRAGRKKDPKCRLCFTAGINQEMEQNDEGMKLNYTGQNEGTTRRRAGAVTDIKYKRKAGQLTSVSRQDTETPN